MIDSDVLEESLVMDDPRDQAIFDKRRQYQDVERALSEIKNERYLSDFGIYHIKTNDTLEDIAPRFGFTVDRLAFINNLPKPYIIFAGSILNMKG